MSPEEVISAHAIPELIARVRKASAENYGMSLSYSVDYLARVLDLEQRYSMQLVGMLKTEDAIEELGNAGLFVSFQQWTHPDPVFGGGEVTFPVVVFHSMFL
jgi:hypothetical protein